MNLHNKGLLFWCKAGSQLSHMDIRLQLYFAVPPIPAPLGLSSRSPWLRRFTCNYGKMIPDCVC